MTDWPVKTLGDVCELSTGGTPSTGNKGYYDGGQIKWLRSGDVHQREIHDCDGRITEEGMRNANTRFLPLNSVLIALAGQGKTRGTVAMLRTKATCNQSVVSIMPVDLKLLLPEFVFWNLHMKYDEIRRMTGDDGNDRRGLSMRLIRSMTIPVPPLEEQKRIVELLDAATAHVTELTACYEEARTHADNLFTSALRAALESNSEWSVKTLGEVAKWGSGGTPQSGVAKYYGGDIPWCVIGDLTEGDVWETERSITEEGLLNSSAKIVDVGAVLIAMYGASIGRTGVVRTRMATNQAIAFAYANQEIVHTDFLLMFLQSQKLRFIDAGQGAAQPNISQLVLKEWPISLPPLEEQKQIVARLDSMRVKTSEMVAAYDAKLAAAKNLRQSILEAAFTGDL